MISGTEIDTQVIDVIRRELHASDQTLNAWTRFVDDLGADSLALIDEEADRIRTVRDAITAVEKYVQARARG
jgi:acyl carrier protein